MGAIIASGWTNTLIFMVLAPIIGLAVGLLVTTATFWVCRNTTPARVDRWFRRLQLVSAASYSLMHGANDAQKTMGISTTHTITGAIVGVGATRRLSAVRWGVAGRIVWAWLLTIPASAAVGALCYWAVSAIGGR